MINHPIAKNLAKYLKVINWYFVINVKYFEFDNQRKKVGYNLLIVKQYLPLFKEAFLNTLKISAFSLIFALVIGLIGGLSRVSKNRFFYGLASIYVNAIRSTPLLAQLYIIFFGLPFIGINFSIFFTGVLTLSLHNGAYITEIVRAGIQAIQKGQTEAALSLGMNYYSLMRKIILPQVLVIFIPPLVNQLADLIKGTALLSTIAYTELTRAADLVLSNSFSPNEGYITSAIIYFGLCYTIMFFASFFEKKKRQKI